MPVIVYKGSLISIFIIDIKQTVKTTNRVIQPRTDTDINCELGVTVELSIGGVGLVIIVVSPVISLFRLFNICCWIGFNCICWLYYLVNLYWLSFTIST